MVKPASGRSHQLLLLSQVERVRGGGGKVLCLLCVAEGGSGERAGCQQYCSFSRGVDDDGVAGGRESLRVLWASVKLLLVCFVSLFVCL